MKHQTRHWQQLGEYIHSAMSGKVARARSSAHSLHPPAPQVFFFNLSPVWTMKIKFSPAELLRSSYFRFIIPSVPSVRVHLPNSQRFLLIACLRRDVSTFFSLLQAEGMRPSLGCYKAQFGLFLTCFWAPWVQFWSGSWLDGLRLLRTRVACVRCGLDRLLPPLSAAGPGLFKL